MISLLYERLPIQCKQCAQRFPDDGVESKKRYEDHIDLHFRQNLRNATASTSTGGVGTMGRGYTRSWFVGKEVSTFLPRSWPAFSQVLITV